VVFVARDPVQRHGQHQGREAGKQREQDDDAHVCCVLGYAGELRRDPLSGSGPAEQDHTGDAGCDIEEEREAGDSCIRCASHVRSSLDQKWSFSSSGVGDSLCGD